MSRRNYIGASDIPYIMGTSPFGTALDLLDAKLGVSDQRAPTNAQEWGIRMESAVLEWILDQERQVAAATVAYAPVSSPRRHPTIPWAGYSPDGVLALQTEAGGLRPYAVAQAKTTVSRIWYQGHSSPRANLPPGILDQVQWEMFIESAIQDREMGSVVGVLVLDEREGHIFRLDPDPTRMTEILERATEFYEQYLRPATTWQDARPDVRSKVLQFDDEAQARQYDETLAAYAKLKQQKESAEKLLTDLRRDILRPMRLHGATTYRGDEYAASLVEVAGQSVPSWEGIKWELVQRGLVDRVALEDIERRHQHTRHGYTRLTVRQQPVEKGGQGV